jgi:hypothetical protein
MSHIARSNAQKPLDTPLIRVIIRSRMCLRETLLGGGNGSHQLPTEGTPCGAISSTSRGILRARLAVPHRNNDSKPTSMGRAWCAADQVLVDRASVDADPLERESTDTHGA